MVKVYYQRQNEKYSASQLANPHLIVLELTQDDPSKFGFSYCGKKIDSEELAKLDENDSVRIVPLPKSEIPTISNEQNAEIESILNKLASFVEQYGNAVFEIYHNETSAGDHVKKFIEKYPKMRHDTQALTALTDFHIFYSYCHMDRTHEGRNAWLRRHPDSVYVIDKILNHLKDSVYSGQFAPMRNPRRYNQQQRPQQQQGGITQMDLQSALAMAFGQIAPNANAQAVPAQVQAPAPVQAQAPPPAQDFTSQLAQLRDFGFEDEDLCKMALEQSGGDVQAALELIVDMMQ